MDVYIISGFLGAGKTTLIQTMVRSVFRGRKIVVLENDFGELGIDSELLRACRLTVTSLSDGCICCSLMGDFERALENIREDYAPELVLVEPSGVGRLSDILKTCFKLEDRGLVCLKKAISVVDVRSFDKYRKNYGTFFEDQLVYADLLLLSHQTGNEQAVRPVSAGLRELNPEADIESRPWADIPASVFLSPERNSRVSELEIEAAVSMKPVRMRGRGRGSAAFGSGRIRRMFAREVFGSVTIEWQRPLTQGQLRQKILHVAAHAEGDILRGKGIVRAAGQMQAEGAGLVFHYLPGSVSIEPINIAGSRVCFIGTDLNEQQIRALFEEK